MRQLLACGMARGMTHEQNPRWIVLLSTIAIGVALPAAANAAAIYFECQLGQDNQPTPDSAPYRWEISVDETRGSVSWVLPSAGGSEEASFTAREVRWQRDGDGVANVYSINRSTLIFTRVAEVGNERFVATGKCRVVRAPPRAF